MKTMRLRPAPALAASFLFAAAAHAQAPVPAPAASGVATLKELCATISMNPADGREMARRAECVLSGTLPSPNRIAEARALAKAAMKAGEPSGGLMLFLAFQADPANQTMRDGKVDAQAYERLGARPVRERQDQVDAIEGLGFAAGHNHRAAAVLAAGYFHDTVAPKNVARTGAMTALLMRMGERHPLVERYAQEADVVARTAAETKTSIRSFFQTYQQAEAVAREAYASQAGAGKTCEKPQLKSVSASDIRGARYLPLQGTVVKDSYLVKGEWTEYWTFSACGEEVPLKVGFVADGWGGATSSVRFNKGD